MVEMPVAGWVALLMSYSYVATVSLAAESLRFEGLISGETARKVIHVGVGVWAVPTVFLFDDWKIAVLPPLTFVLVNFVIHRFRLLPGLGDDPTNLGTVFFPISFAGLLALFFRPGEASDAGYAAVAGLLAMALGDAAAAIVGKRYGTRRYIVFGHARTMEGSFAVFLVSGAAVAAVLSTMAGLDLHPALALGLVSGTAAAGIEAFCPYGSDNLFVPVGVAGLVFALVEITSAAVGA